MFFPQIRKELTHSWSWILIFDQIYFHVLDFWKIWRFTGHVIRKLGHTAGKLGITENDRLSWIRYMYRSLYLLCLLMNQPDRGYSFCSEVLREEFETLITNEFTASTQRIVYINKTEDEAGAVRLLLPQASPLHHGQVQSPHSNTTPLTQTNHSYALTRCLLWTI